MQSRPLWARKAFDISVVMQPRHEIWYQKRYSKAISRPSVLDIFKNPWFGEGTIFLRQLALVNNSRAISQPSVEMISQILQFAQSPSHFAFLTSHIFASLNNTHTPLYNTFLLFTSVFGQIFVIIPACDIDRWARSWPIRSLGDHHASTQQTSSSFVLGWRA